MSYYGMPMMQPQPQSNNTMIFVVIGVAVAAVIILMLNKNKTTAAVATAPKPTATTTKPATTTPATAPVVPAPVTATTPAPVVTAPVTATTPTTVPATTATTLAPVVTAPVTTTTAPVTAPKITTTAPATTAPAPVVTAPAPSAQTIVNTVIAYSNQLVRCNATGATYFIEGGKKRYVDVDNSIVVSGALSTDISCDVLAAIPDGEPFIGERLAGNNGSVSCADFVGGIWMGQSGIPAKHPTWAGGFPLTATPVGPEGACPVAITRDPRFTFVSKIANNNGTVDCNTFCSGEWGKLQLASKWPGVPGARVAPGAPLLAASDGTCWCAPKF